eukprot:scaffold412_cov118-Skeletonema_marinoi.AAC.2
MQAGAIRRVGAAEADFAHSCGFINRGGGAAWRMSIPTEARARRGIGNVRNIGGTTVHSPCGIKFNQDLLTAVVFAQQRYGCQINLAPYYSRFNGGVEAMQRAIEYGLPGNGWVVQHKRNNGTINKVHIWSPTGMFYDSYYQLQNLEGISIQSIRDDWFLERLRRAEEQHLPQGWSATARYFVSPDGDSYESIYDALIVSHVCLPINVHAVELKDYQRIVKSLSNHRRKDQVMTNAKIAAILGLGLSTVRTILSGSNTAPHGDTLYSISQFLGNNDMLREVAFDEGVPRNIPVFDAEMEAARRQRDRDLLYNFDFPEPISRAERPPHADAAPVAAADPVAARPVLELNEVLPHPADLPPLPAPALDNDAGYAAV